MHSTLKSLPFNVNSVLGLNSSQTCEFNIYSKYKGYFPTVRTTKQKIQTLNLYFQNLKPENTSIYFHKTRANPIEIYNKTPLKEGYRFGKLLSGGYRFKLKRNKSSASTPLALTITHVDEIGKEHLVPIKNIQFRKGQNKIDLLIKRECIPNSVPVYRVVSNIGIGLNIFNL